MDYTNKLFAELEAQWKAYCEAHGESYAEYAAPAMAHARQVAAEDPADVKYGVFTLKDGDEYVCLMHANWTKLPKTDGKTVRILWVLLAPKFDFEDVKPQDIAKITTSLIMGTVALAKSQMASENIKLHIGNILDNSILRYLQPF